MIATMKVLLLLEFLIAITFAGDSSEERVKAEDAQLAKEVNYKKFIGETNYRLPFKTRISQPFQEGQTIHAVGQISNDPKRVDFNFHEGAQRDADMPLHLSIRFDEGKLVYNTYKEGNWSENEQRIKNPFKPNEEFDLRVRIINGNYQVFANRVEVGSFQQRMPLDGVDHVSISGDLANLRLFHYGGRVFPNPYAAIAKVVPGKRLDVSALPTGKRVNVNLYRSNREYALHVSIRYGEGAVVRNAMTNNVWGTEEREGGLPINKGEIFDLTIINEEFSFQIFMNGKRFAAFSHRGSPNDIETVEIDGTVEVLTVTVNDAVGV
uniref:Galectin n=1 Tax=Parascaris univalens TaxID=6257 RepID=A0A915AP20_PARUN